MTSHTVTNLDELQQLFGAVGEASLRKEVPFIHPVYRKWIEASPFAVLATSGPEGLDASPRGDPAGFAVVQDDKTLLLPERRGKPPQCVLVIDVDSVFFQCARAMQRSQLWSARASRPEGVPTAGEILQALTEGGIDGAKYDADLPQRRRKTLY